MSGAGLYVFAIVRAGQPVPTSVGGTVASSLRAVREGELAAVVGDAPERLRPRRRDLMAHQDVLSALAAGGPLLPMRFGTVAADEDIVRGQLREGHERHARALDRLAGRCEFNVKAQPTDRALARVVRDDPAVLRLRNAARARPGFEAEVRLGEAVASALSATAARAGEDLVRELASAAVEACEGPAVRGCVVNASFLVETASAEVFRATADRLAGARADEAELRVTGPLPCYSFVEAPAGVTV